MIQMQGSLGGEAEPQKWGEGTEEIMNDMTEEWKWLHLSSRKQIIWKGKWAEPQGPVGLQRKSEPPWEQSPSSRGERGWYWKTVQEVMLKFLQIWQ